MPLQLLLDGNLRDRGLWAAISQHNASSDEKLDVVRVGDPDGPALGIRDPELIAWAAAAAVFSSVWTRVRCQVIWQSSSTRGIKVPV